MDVFCDTDMTIVCYLTTLPHTKFIYRREANKHVALEVKGKVIPLQARCGPEGG